jgi:hypothetical protein
MTNQCESIGKVASKSIKRSSRTRASLRGSSGSRSMSPDLTW